MPKPDRTPEETFRWFPGEYQRNKLDKTYFLPFGKLQSECRRINKDGKNSTNVYTACTEQSRINCAAQNIPRPSSATYFLRDLQKAPDVFSRIQAHEDDHQKALYAMALVSCDSLYRDENSNPPANPQAAKEAKKRIQRLISEMDQIEQVEKDESGQYSFERRYEMQPKLEEALELYIKAMNAGKIKQSQEAFQKPFGENE